MTKRTTESWEALLNGTTPGPWEYREHEYCPCADMEDRATIHGGPMPEIPYPCGCEEDDTCEVQRYVVGTEDGVWAHNPPFWEARPADMKAVAHFPEVVDELVRLRRALEELRDCYRHREARSRERLESVTDEREQSHLARFAHMHKRTHEALTRILEGGNDE